MSGFSFDKILDGDPPKDPAALIFEQMAMDKRFRQKRDGDGEENMPPKNESGSEPELGV